MYGKIFSSTFSGSMFGAGAHVFAVWSYVIANAQDSRIELNPQMLASILGTTPRKAEEAIEYLCRPDPESRNPEHEGRRLVREGQFQYLVVSHSIYRGMKDNDEQRAYNRDRKRKSRENQKDKDCHTKKSQLVTAGHTQSIQATSASASAYMEGNVQELGTGESQDEIPFAVGEGR